MTLAPQDTSLVALAVERALDALQAEAIQRAREAADGLVGVVVTTDDDAKAVTECLSIVKRGQKAAASALDTVLKPHKRAIESARVRFREVTAILDEAEKGAKAGLAGHIEAKERALRVERERQQAEARRIAEAQRKAEADEAIPEMEAPPPPPAPTQVRGSAGAFTHTSSVLKVEMIDPHEVAGFDPTLLELRVREACNLYREAEKNGDLGLESPQGGFQWHGMLFRRERTIVAH